MIIDTLLKISVGKIYQVESRARVVFTHLQEGL